MEEWIDIPGFGEKYQVSNMGRIKSLDYRRTGNEMIMKVSKNSQGRPSIALCKDGKRYSYLVHRIVWISFNGVIPEGYEVNHINEDCTDNRLENLNLMTHKENINYGTHNKRMGKSKRKMVEQHTLDGIHICTWFSSLDAERELGYNNSSIGKCCLGKAKTAYGYIWKFAKSATSEIKSN